MSSRRECYLVLVFLAVAGKSAESALAFTRTPDDPTYVVKGDNATLVWEYSVDDRQIELKGIVWTVTVKATGNPAILVVETKSGNRSNPANIPQAYKGRVSVEETATLVIQNVTLEDSTTFSCSLRAESVPSAVDTEAGTRLLVTVPPTASSAPAVIYVNVGDSSSFTCITTGIPTPNITWYRSGQKVISGSHYEVLSVTANSSQLNIINVTHADHGYYECRATSNRMEPADALSFLGVIKDAVQDDALCPKATYEANIGDGVALCCPVSGNPPPEVEWTFHDMKLQTSLATNLVIQPVKESNYGSYYCTARSLEKAAGPFSITLNKTEKISIETVATTQPDTFKWSKVDGAVEYIVRISGQHISSFSLLGDKQKTSLEIPYSTLRFMSEEMKKSPVEVNIDVLAIDESNVIGEGRNFTLIISVTTTPSPSFILVIVLFMMVVCLQ